MSAKVDQTSPVEPRSANMSSTALTSGPKISMFATKSGFVIPKNKLSGSMVQVCRGGKKPAGNDAASEKSTNQVQRKTKWGPDLTQDAAVRRGRVLTYQTRVDQITLQLKSGILEVRDNQDSPSAAQDADDKSSNSQVDSEKLELLELERREAIGEILKLNPSYKAPADYKPLMKVARVPIPVKEYPEFNFVGLIFGPGGDTQKRLEKETGAKIQVYGTKANTGEKVEISPPDENEIQGAYEELYVYISAETFEKVDAAVAVIELLVTSVSGNLGAASASASVSGDDGSVPCKSQDAVTPYVVPTAVIYQGVAQPVVGSMQTPPQGQFQYHGPWFIAGPNQTPMHSPLNSSAPILNNPVLQSSPISFSNMPSLFGPRPVSGFNSILPNPSVPPSSQPNVQVLVRPYMPQTHPLGHSGPPRNFVSAPQPFSAPPNILGPFPFTGRQLQSTGPVPTVRPLMPSLPQPVSSVPPRPVSDYSLTPAWNSTGWSGASADFPASLGPRNIGQSAPLMVPPFEPCPVPLQPGNVCTALASSISATNMVSFATFLSGSSNPQLNRPAAPVFASGPSPIVGPSPTKSASPNPSVNPVTGSNSIFTPVPPSLHAGISGSVSGSMANFAPINPPTAAGQKPLHPSSGNFTFQLQQQQNPASLMGPRPSIQPASSNIPPPRPMGQLPAPQTLSFRLSVPNSTSQPVMQVFPRPQLGNQMGHPQANLSCAPFGSNRPAMSRPPRFPAFQNAGPPAPVTPVSQIRLRNYGPPPQMSNIAATFPRRPVNPMQLQQNYPSPTAQPQNLMPPNQRFDNNPSFTSRKLASSHSSGQQFYDPFSPTSVPVVPRQQGGNPSNVRKQENDPEYEDLMASVGVK